MFPRTWASSVLALVPLPPPSPIAAECVPWEFLEALSCLSWSPLCSVYISLSSPLVMGTELAALTGECPLPIPPLPHRSNPWSPRACFPLSRGAEAKVVRHS